MLDCIVGNYNLTSTYPAVVDRLIILMDRNIANFTKEPQNFNILEVSKGQVTIVLNVVVEEEVVDIQLIDTFIDAKVSENRAENVSEFISGQKPIIIAVEFSKKIANGQVNYLSFFCLHFTGAQKFMMQKVTAIDLKLIISQTIFEGKKDMGKLKQRILIQIWRIYQQVLANLFNFLLLYSYFIIFFPTIYMAEQQQSQWIVVTKNKQKHKGAIQNKTIHNKSNQSFLSPDKRKSLKQKTNNSSEFEKNKKIFSDHLQTLCQSCVSKKVHFECLGLGSFLNNQKAFIQLHIFQQIVLPFTIRELERKRDLLNQGQNNVQKEKVSYSLNIYDPIFTQSQKAYIQKEGASSNQSFEIKKGGLNVFFMPHCQRFLYEKVYEKFNQVVDQEQTRLLVIGNSIREYIERCHLIKEKVPTIFTQIKLKQDKLHDIQNALNDTFVFS